jgi:lipopolysaccharide biosynthesis protein
MGEIVAHLLNVPFPLDVFVSTDTEAKRAALLRHLADWPGGAAEVRVMPNRGRDIAPKLVGFRDVHLRYDYVLHLHSKRSTHGSFLAPWRTYLYQTLAGSPGVVRSIFEVFDRLPRVGIVTPQHFEPIRRYVGWGRNFGIAEGLARRMGIALRPGAALDFPSGSMFWARTAALRPLLDLDLSVEDFPMEAGQLDGTPAHAIERLFFLACEAAGFDCVKVADPALMRDPRPIRRLRDAAALEASPGFARLLSGEVATRPFVSRFDPRAARGLVARLTSFGGSWTSGGH